MQLSQQQFYLTFLLTLGLFVSRGAFAGEWNTRAGVAVSSIYTDNVCLSKNNEMDQVIATATPDIRLKGEGGRANMDLYGALEFNTLANGSTECANRIVGNKESPAPRLRFKGHSELVQRWLYFDASAFIDQNRVNAFGASGGDNLNGRGNTNTTYNYNLSPYISRRLGDTANFLLRYTYNEQANSASILRDSTAHRVVVDLGSSPQNHRLSMGVNARYSEVSYDQPVEEAGTFNNELSSARFRAAYRISPTWQLNGFVGKENNDFVSISPDIDGTLWDVGVRWTPNSRVTMAAGTGERFFGSTPRFSIQYRHKRSYLSASYRRALTYDRNLRGRDQFATSIDELVEEIDPETGGPAGGASAPTVISNSPILNERFQLVYRFNARRTTFSATASHSKQTRAEDGRDSIFTDIGISAQRKLSRLLSLYSRLTWNEREAAEDRSVLVRDSDTWRYNLGLRRRLGQKTSASLSYRYSQRNSEVDFDEYQENRITFTLRHRF